MYDSDDEWNAPDWADDDAESATLPCPRCGAEVFEDTDQCPHCGDWIMPGAAAARWPAWIRIAAWLAVLGLLAVLLRGVWRFF